MVEIVSMETFLCLATVCLMGGAFALFMGNVIDHILDGAVETDDESF